MPSGVYVRKHYKHTEAFKEKLRQAHKRHNWGFQKGHKLYAQEKSSNWKGNEVKYSGLHIWVRKYLGKHDTCEHCGKTGLKGKKIHWANKSRKYQRNLEDWIRLCASCHSKYDNKINNINKMPIPIPKCDSCNTEMKLKDKNGEKFWGCPNYFKCKGKTKRYDGVISKTPQLQNSPVAPLNSNPGYKQPFAQPKDKLDVIIDKLDELSNLLKENLNL